MQNEKDILLNINQTITELLNNICDYNLKFNIIKENILFLDNNYFTKDNNKKETVISKVFDNRIELFTQYLLNYKNIVEDNLQNICNHEWVEDEIDINPDNSQKITYCRLCEVTKRIN
jgi:hypothetical protein